MVILEVSDEEFERKIQKAVDIAIEKFSTQATNITYLTRQQVTEKLHISLPTLNEYTKSGKLKGYKIMGRVLYKEDEIDAALESIETLKYSRI